MRRRPFLLAWSFILTFSPALRAAPRRFDPERHFPKDCYFYADVDFGALRKGFRGSPLGALVSHPGIRKALGNLPDVLIGKIREETAEFTEEMGLDLLQFLDLFQGRISLTSSHVDNRDGPRVVFAVDLAKKRKEILKFADRLARLEATEGGTEEIRGYTVKRFDMRWGPPLFTAELEQTLLFSVGAELDEIIGLYKSDSGRGALRSNPEFKEMRSRNSDLKPIGTYFLNIKALREAMFRAFREFGGGPEHQVMSVLEFTGLDRASSVSYELALTDGDWEGRFLVLSPGGLGGALKVLAESISGAGDLSGLEKVPERASAVACYSVHTGRLFKDGQALLEKLAENVPEGAPDISAFTRGLEEMSGLSIKKDLYTLPRLRIWGFQAMPPSGSVLPDAVALARISEVTPYVAILEKFAAKLGARIEPLEVAGRTVAYLRFDGLLEKLGLRELLGIPERSDGDERSSFDVGFALVLVPLDEEWMLLTTSPQTARRYFDVDAKGRKIAELPEVMEVVSGRIGRTAAFGLFRGGKALLAVYNSLVSLANRLAPQLARSLEPYGADPAHLPPAEEFLPLFKDGFVYARTRSDSIVVHGHRGLTNIMGCALPWAGYLAMKIGLSVAEVGRGSRLVVAPVSGKTRALQLYGVLEQYTKESGSRAFPNDPGGSLAAFQKLADSGVLEDPSVLVHPASTDLPAASDALGKLKLAGHNVSYVIVPWKQGPSDSPSRLLCYEKKPFVRGGRHVIFVRGRVEFLSEAEFRRLLRSQTGRYGKTK